MDKGNQEKKKEKRKEVGHFDRSSLQILFYFIFLVIYSDLD
uniref:Uncharacterized protein n=1 Tax=Rhizophora mucronata TaxID=61149 RepID=A0A2P2PSP1_RHIMU